MYSAIIFERQQVVLRELINKEVQGILDKEDE